AALLRGPHVPDADRAVAQVARGDERLAVGREAQRLDGVADASDLLRLLLTAQFGGHPSFRQVPQADDVRLVPHRQGLAVRGEGERRNLVVAAEWLQFFAAGRVPQGDGRAPPADGQGLAVGGQGIQVYQVQVRDERPHLDGGPEGPQLLAGFAVPEV